jgi:DNA-directed RNA polymerase sigma subunit (sigma70/sigma32)
MWEQMQDTCALDIAERGEHTLEEVGEALGVTRERVRQIEVRALRKLAHAYPELEEQLIHLLNRTTKDDQ